MSERSSTALDEDFIESRRNTLPSFLRNNLATKRILIFEGIGTFLFMYGCCCSQYLLPDYKRIPNPFHSVFISLSLFLATCWSGAFTGGHVNPAVTVALVRKQNGMKWREGLLYIAAQFVGAILAAFAAWNFFDQKSSPYWQSGLSFGDLFLDTLSEIFGAFFFTLFLLILNTKDTTFINDTYWKYLFIPILLYICRTFSFRIGCLNPALGFAIELVQAVYNSEPILILYSMTMVIGPLLGGILSAWFFNGFYRPIYLNWKEQAYGE